MFPIVLLDWRLTDDLTLRTRGSTGPGQGPELRLDQELGDGWSVAAGARYETLRFRLDDSGAAPGGVGEEQAFPVFLSLSRTWNGDDRFALFAGVELGGDLRLDDAGGQRLRREDYEPAPFFGLLLELKF